VEQEAHLDQGHKQIKNDPFFKYFVWTKWLLKNADFVISNSWSICRNATESETLFKSLTLMRAKNPKFDPDGLNAFWLLPFWEKAKLTCNKGWQVLSYYEKWQVDKKASWQKGMLTKGKLTKRQVADKMASWQKGKSTKGCGELLFLSVKLRLNKLKQTKISQDCSPAGPNFK
jgi:hypothetical protein